MSILKVNDIRRATTGSAALVINDPVIITTGSISASVLIGSLPGAVTIGDGTIGKEKLTNDARDWVNVLNKPAGLISSSNQIAGSLTGASISVANITSSGNITTTGYFSGSGVYLYDIPNSALTNNSITINGVVTPLGLSRTLVTADISESSNLYYTEARVKSKLNAEGVFSSSGQVNYQSVQGQFSVNTLGSDGNKSFTVSAGIFMTGSTGIDISTDAPNAKIVLKTTGGTVSSSAQVKANLPADTVSSSTQVKTFLPDGTVSASAQYPGWVTASSQIDYNSIQNKLSGVVSASAQVQPLLPAGTVSSSTQFNNTASPFTGSFTGSLVGQFTGLVAANNNVVSSSAQVKAFLPGGSVSASAQYPGWVTASSQIVVQNTTGIGAIATTGSNTFVGNQTMSGSVTVTGNLNVLGSSSILYTTASELIVGDNKIVVNSTDTLRFAGLQIIDSGSVSPTTASLYWDSLNHKFIYENLSGSGYNSSIIIAGPKNFGTLGNEPVLVSGRIPVATDDDHLDNRLQSSSIRVDFATRRTDVEAGLYVTGGLTVQGNISGNLLLPANTVSSSTQVTQFLSSNTVSSSTQVVAFLPTNTVSSSTQVKAFLPGGSVSSSAQYPGWVTASSQIDYNSITNKLSGVVSSSAQVQPLLPAGTVSSSNQVAATSTTGFTAGVEQVMRDNNVHSGSFLGTATTNNLTEGFTNLYYTDVRVKTKLNVEGVHSGSSLGSATTTNLPEGTNQYFTSARVITALPPNTVSSSNQVNAFLPAGTVSSSAQINLSQAFNTASHALTASYAMVTVGTTAANTDGLPQGTTNLYYSDSLVKTKLNTDNVHSGSFLGTATTTNLTEGVNLYFTNGRVVNALPAGTVSSSTQVRTLLPAGTVSSSAQVIPFPFTGSAAISGSLTVTGSTLINSTVIGLGDVSDPASYQLITGRQVTIGTPTSNAALSIVTSNAGIGYIFFADGTSGTEKSAGGFHYSHGTNTLALYAFSDIRLYMDNTAMYPNGTMNLGTTTSRFNSAFVNNYIGTVVSSSRLIVTSSTELSGPVTASALTPNQAVFTNTSDGLVSNAITGTGNVVMSASPTLTGTITAQNITATGTMLLAGIVSQSSQIDYNSITNKLSGVYSSSTQAVAAIAGQTITPSIINATGVISGASVQVSGTSTLLGNVAVGISTPSARLHVASATGNNQPIIFTNSDFAQGSTGSGLIVAFGVSSGNTYAQLYGFQAGNTQYANLIIPGGNVGIGTVSPQTMFHVAGGISGSSIDISGRTDIAQVREKLNTKTGATGTVTHDYSTGAIFYHSSISANFTINLTNVPTDNDKTIAITVVLNQGASGYYPSAFQIDGSAQTLRWANNETPTPSINKVDVATFSLIRTGGSWIVLGNYTPFA